MNEYQIIFIITIITVIVLAVILILCFLLYRLIIQQPVVQSVEKYIFYSAREDSSGMPTENTLVTSNKSEEEKISFKREIL